MGQEHPRVPGNRSPGRPVLPVEGKAGPGGRGGGVPAEHTHLMQQPGRHRVPGLPVPVVPVRSLLGGWPRAHGCLREERAAGRVLRGSERERVEMKKLTCQELFTEASGEDYFTADLKESGMFNVQSALPQPSE